VPKRHGPPKAKLSCLLEKASHFGSVVAAIFDASASGGQLSKQEFVMSQPNYQLAI